MNFIKDELITVNPVYVNLSDEDYRSRYTRYLHYAKNVVQDRIKRPKQGTADYIVELLTKMESVLRRTGKSNKKLSVFSMNQYRCPVL